MTATSTVALGGKTSAGTSAVIARSQRKWALYRRAVARVGVINSEDAARRYRRVLVRFGMVNKALVEAICR